MKQDTLEYTKDNPICLWSYSYAQVMSLISVKCRQSLEQLLEIAPIYRLN